MGLRLLRAVGAERGGAGQEEGGGGEDEIGVAQEIKEEEVGRGGGKASHSAVPREAECQVRGMLC